MPALKKYSIVGQAPGAEPYTVCAYNGTDLSNVLGISQADSMPQGHYGWMLLPGGVEVRVGIPGGTQTAYADFRPNDAKAELSKMPAKDSQQRYPELPLGVLDEKALARKKYKEYLRLSQLPPLLIEIGPYCNLLKEARDVFVDGHFYACVAMCGISFERFQRDKAKPYGATRKHKIWQVRKILCNKKVLQPKTLTLCEKMADLRNDYVHGHGLKPKKDALKALGWLHRFISNETDLMQDYVIVDGMLHRKQ
jgi:hypothetical protein